MRYDLIKTDNYLLICDDSEIKVGDYIYDLDLQKIVIANDLKAITSKSANCWYYKKIIAHLPLNGAPYLDDVSVLPSLLKEDDVQKLADEASQKFKRNDELDDLILGVSANSFEEGYNKAREKYKFTEEDMLEFTNWCRIHDNNHKNEVWTIQQLFEKYKSLQQQKIPVAFECEIQESHYVSGGLVGQNTIGGKGLTHHTNKTIKTIINFEGRVEWVGKYIWE
jgi:hypothetical protein